MPLVEWIGAAESIATIIALTLAGLWTYFHYLRGRTHRPSLEVAVEGQVHAATRKSLLIARTTLENVGLSKVDIEQMGTGLRVLAYDNCDYSGAPTFFASVPEHLGTVTVFAKHRWIEPKETVVDEWLFVVPTGRSAFHLDLRVTTGLRAWSAQRIILVEARSITKSRPAKGRDNANTS